jgi:hypothetical protein
VPAWEIAVLLRDLLRLVELAADDRHHANAGDVLDAVEVLHPERAGARERDIDRLVVHCRILQDEMADGRVRRGHVIEAMRDLGLGPARDVGHRAARDQPHHELDAFRSRLAHIFDVTDLRQSVRVVDEAIEELVVPLGVDEARARALQLMAHAAGAPDLHVQGLVIALDRLADRLPEHEAAASRGHWVLHHVDREGNDRARPSLRLPEHERQRNGQAVVDIHLVDDGQVEVVLDHALRDMRGELRMADDLRHGPRSPAFVGRLELGRGADRERGNDLERERARVVVVHEEDDVRAMLPLPFLRELVAAEHLGPVRLGRLAEIERRADGGHVRGVNGRGDACHDQLLLSLG